MRLPWITRRRHDRELAAMQARIKRERLYHKKTGEILQFRRSDATS